MTFHDAFRNQRKYESVDTTSPSKPDVSFLMQRAAQNAPHEFNMKWQKSEMEPRFALSICYTDGSDGEPTWKLTADAQNVSTELWSKTTENPDEIHLLILKTMAAPPPAPKRETPSHPSPLGESPSNDAQAYRKLAHNEQFATRYRILQQIGHGGMGRIYQAVDVPNNRLIALKVLHPHLVEDEDAVQRFEREAKSSIGLRHPNLVTVYDFGFSDYGLPYIAMEYLDGEMLQQLLKIDGPLEVRRFLTIFLQICSALHHAHTHRVIHRDVKPSNIMLIKVDENSNLAKLIDFGIAKIVDGKTAQRLTQTGDVFGSPFYMSPEQCMGVELDERSDIYSLGCVMYEAISGVRPFEGENAMITMQMQVSGHLEPFAHVCPDLAVPPQIESIIFRALEKKPEDRFQSAKQLGAELERLLSVDQINQDNQWISNQTRSGTFYAQLPSKGLQERADLAKVIDLLKECDLITGVEHRYAMQLVNSGAEVSKYLTGSARISEQTLHSAVQCQKILERGECKLEMAVIALHYCHRNGIMLREAFDQLGWRITQ